VSNGYFAGASGYARCGDPFNGDTRLINGGADLETLTLPAGSYLISAKASVCNEDSDDQDEFCELKVGPTDLDRSDFLLDGAHGTFDVRLDQQVVPLQTAQSFTEPTTVVLRCSGSNSIAAEYALSAVKVSQLN
jgi:hypothetical protein